jgi:hypothetical protein
MEEATYGDNLRLGELEFHISISTYGRFPVSSAWC